MTADGLARLREPFAPHQVSKLPKNVAKEGNQAHCTVCGGWHRRAGLHLDYVGHAALTDRLLDVDPEWSWEPVAFGADGLPALDRNGGLWIRLTVCGVTRLGYGHADGKTGGDAIKEAIGDALRNAGMRFGAALDLWHKGDLHGDGEPGTEAAAPSTPTRTTDAEWIDNFRQRITASMTPAEVRALWSEAVQKYADLQLTDEDSKALEAEMRARTAEIKGEVAA